MAITQQRLTEVDPAFPVPPNVIDVRQLNKDDGEHYYEEGDLVEEEPILADPDSELAMPPGFTIYEQRIRMASDGRAVVDVTLEFQDIAGVMDIELQVTKI